MRKANGASDGADARPCSHPGCSAAGEYRAPVSPTQPRDFQYFCLEHIRAFNKSWNFFEGWTPDEIVAWRHADLSWHRPTWPSVAGDPGAAFHGFRYDDLFGVTHEAAGGAQEEAGTCDAAVPGEQRRAFAILELDPGADVATIKRRFKNAVKRCHPDVNGNGPKDGRRLRDVIWAYRQLVG